MVINVAQASSLHRQDAYATLILILLITTKSEEPEAIQNITEAIELYIESLMMASCLRGCLKSSWL
jgi:hypothetical protein